MIEAAHERAIERVLEWIEDEVAVIRYGKDGIYRVRPPGGSPRRTFSTWTPAWTNSPDPTDHSTLYGCSPGPYDAPMTARRSLGPGPQAAHSIRAAQADLLDALPGVRLPDLSELRGRGVLGAHPAPAPTPRRTLGAGARTEEKPSRPPA
ncbi:hypothetical protein [Streptomyces sp. NPDC040750]|uniref:hypothetical protein n=1 Tax=Streptomyces sp. NPDC040750 TaxID=3154491 RepID=UPI0033E16A85